MIQLGFPLWPVAQAEGRTADGEFIILCYQNFSIIMVPTDWLRAWADGLVIMEPMLAAGADPALTFAHIQQAASFCSSVGIF